MVLSLDQLAVPALLLVLILGGMRLLYGAWPWEVSKTWYRTRQAVAYVESLRAERKADPALRLIKDADDSSTKGTIKDEEARRAVLLKDAAESSTALRQLLNSIDSSNDTFDRDSAPDVSEQSSETGTTRKPD